MKKTTAIKLNKDFRFLYYRGGSNVSRDLVFYFRKNKQGTNHIAPPHSGGATNMDFTRASSIDL